MNSQTNGADGAENLRPFRVTRKVDARLDFIVMASSPQDAAKRVSVVDDMMSDEEMNNRLNIVNRCEVESIDSDVSVSGVKINGQYRENHSQYTYCAVAVNKQDKSGIRGYYITLEDDDGETREISKKELDAEFSLIGMSYEWSNPVGTPDLEQHKQSEVGLG